MVLSTCFRIPPYTAQSPTDWEALGNPGWNWDNYAKYSARTE
jgi:hypothetical protein